MIPSQSASHPLQRLFWIVTTVSLGFVMVQLDVSIVNVALPSMGATLHTRMEGLQAVVDAYSLAFAALLLSAGALGDRLGARRVFTLGLGVFTAASAACGLATQGWMLIASRAVQGMGGAMIMPSSLALIHEASQGDHVARSRAIGVWTAAGGMALSAGPVLGGALVHCWGWPSIFWVNLPLGLLILGMAPKGFLKTTAVPSKHRGFDLFGQGFAIVMLCGATGAIIKAGSLGWRHPLVLMGFGIALVSGLAFIFMEAHGTAPALPLSFFRNPTFSVVSLVGFGVSLTFYGMVFAFGLYFQQVRHYSPAAAGMAFLPFLVLVPVTNIVSGYVVSRCGVRKPMILGLMTATFGLSLLTGVGPETPYLSLMWRLLLVPLGTAFSVPPMITALLSSIPQDRSGIASGVFNAIRQTAGAIGVALFGSLIARDMVGGMKTALTMSAAMLALGVVLVMLGVRGWSKRPP